MLGVLLAVVWLASAAFAVAMARRERRPGRGMGLLFPGLAAFGVFNAAYFFLRGLAIGAAWYRPLILAAFCALGVAFVGAVVDNRHRPKR